MNTTELFDMFLIISIFSCVCIIGWILHRETARSKKNLEVCQKSLDDEHRALTLRISERTQQLLDSHQRHNDERERVAHFGALSKGLFHDLMGPLSAVSLSVEQLATDPGELSQTRTLISQATQASRRMSAFMENLRAHIATSTYPTHTRTDTSRELSIVLDLLAYKARMAGVSLHIDHADTIELPIHPVRFQQLLINVLSNAIESCEQADSLHDHEIHINITQKKNEVTISVTDTGIGIPLQHVHDVVVRPFSTKEKGTGTGLMTVRSIVHDELRGTITITNAPTRGAICTITVPL